MTILDHFVTVTASAWVNARLPFGTWAPVSAPSVGATIQVPGGAIFVCTTPGITANTQPTWPTGPQNVTVSDGIDVVWTMANLLPASMQGFDQRAMQAINGDDGGTWAPLGQILVQGSTFGLKAAAPTTIWGTGGYLQTVGSSRFVMNDTFAWPLLGPTHAGRTRNLRSSFLGARTLPWSQLHPHVGANGCLDGMVQTASRSTTPYNGNPQPTVIVAPIEVHDRSTLSSVTINWAVPSQPSTLPSMPQARVCRVDTSGNVTFLTSAASGADSNGRVAFPAPASASSYYNGGVCQSWVIPCDQNNAIDNSQYTYEVQITEEQNGSSVPVLQAVDLVTNATFAPGGPATNSPGTIDGVTPTIGMRILYKDQPIAQQNGIYVIVGDGSGTPGHFGTSVRATDMAEGAPFVAGTQVPVKSGGVALGNSLYTLAQAASVPYTNYTTWESNAPIALGTVVVASTAFGFIIPNGFIYRCTTAGTTSSAGAPTWPVAPGQTVVDGSVTWTAFAIGGDAPMYFEVMGKPSPTLAPTWLPTTAYNTGAVVSPSVPNGYQFIMLESGPLTSGSTEPSWNLGPGIKTSDAGGLVWWAIPSPPFAPAKPAGNVWAGISAECTNIQSLRFQ